MLSSELENNPNLMIETNNEQIDCIQSITCLGNY